ncbi:prolyl-tRNA synthetase [Kaistella sp. BT6-1-3]|uniref:Prolyl-tRNA synthetase n=1 Tax=Kaistella yananensis TaxID=2989820 RepID=A0ABT3JNI5_9FLAO|nr:prolyl-tRNA synthetase [Kaistella yananensis]MCW4452030.1 prolyl-tRNA synthetase [Kaistella yananensis]
MEKITYKNLPQILKSKVVLALAGGLILMSCGSQMGGYSETDGVYYDPNRDTLPEGTVMNSGNRVGEYYDYQATDDQNKYLNSENRNESWKDQNSDWGNYAGTDIFYNDTWGYPYGMYSGWGLNFGFGPYWGYGGYYSPWGMGYNPWYGYYSPWYGYYSPYYGYYNPYYGYSLYGYYSPYGYGYGMGYNSYNGGFTYKRSGADGGFRNSLRNSTPNSTIRNNNYNSGFRNDTPRMNSTQPNNPRYNRPENSTQPRLRATPRPDSSPRQTTPRQSSPSYSEPRIRSNSNDGGFRSGSSGGGFNSGSSNTSSGSSRSGGGFRR